jgi:putative transposase
MLNVKKISQKSAQNYDRFRAVSQLITISIHDTFVPEACQRAAGSPTQNDYPVLNTRLFVKFWLGFTLDQSLTSMRDLFKRLNNTGFSVDISTFSKANVIEAKNHLSKFIKSFVSLLTKILSLAS